MFHFTPRMLCFIAQCFLPCLHPPSFTISIFRQANKNVTWRQNSGKSGSEYWQGALAVISVPGISSFPSCPCREGCLWLWMKTSAQLRQRCSQGQWMLCFALRTSQSITQGAWAALWLCRWHQCIQQLHVCLVGVSKRCSRAAGPPFEKQNGTARNEVPFLCSTCSVLRG